MRVLDYLRAVAVDFVLCLALAGVVSFINGGAFFVDPALQYNYFLIAGVCAALLAVFFFAAFSKRTVVPGIALAFVALLVGVFVAHHYAADGVLFYADEEGNPVVFFIVMYVCTLAAFVATRKRFWCQLFYVALALDFAFVQFMYEQNYVVPVLIAVAVCVVMVVYRNYRHNVSTASSTQISFAGAFGVGLAFAAVVCGLAFLIFFAVIAPMNPDAHEFKPFTRYLNYETIEMTGVANNLQVENPEQQTDEINENEDETNEDTDEEELDSNADQTQGMLQALLKMVLTAVDNAQQLIEELFVFVEEHSWVKPFILLLLLGLLYLPFWLKYRARKKRYEELCALPPREQVRAFFHFFMKRFAILKIRKGDLMTLREWTFHSRHTFAEFENNDGRVTFGDIIQLYACVIYSEYEPDEDDLEMIRVFYGSFYKNFVEVSGKLKYVLFFRFWRI